VNEFYIPKPPMMIGEEKSPDRTNLLWSDGKSKLLFFDITAIFSAKKKEDMKVMKSHSDDEQFVQYKYFKTIGENDSNLVRKKDKHDRIKMKDIPDVVYRSHILCRSVDS
jgi:hypothetical protein